MLCSICSELFDYTGNHLFELDLENSDLPKTSRRVSRTATLDGGCVVVDNGFTVADNTFQLALPRTMDKADQDSLESTVQLHSSLSISVDGGIYSGVCESVTWGDKRKIKVLITGALNG